MPQRLVLVIRYDGTRYHGFQFQKNALTIQEELERALKKFTSENIRVTAASRTDAGVHACGQVVSFVSEADYPSQTWVRALNHYLPADIVVRKAFIAPLDFNVRKTAISREYIYFIFNSPVPSPFSLRFAYFLPKLLDIEAMNQACQFLLGKKDLASFTPSTKVKNTVRTVYQAVVRRIKKELLCFYMVADAFLPHQVRHTIGALVKVGLGKMGVEDFVQILDKNQPGLAGPALPPKGLFLLRVNYPNIFQLPEEGSDITVKGFSLV